MQLKLPGNFETYLRAVLAAGVILLTFLMTVFKPGADAIPKEWEAIFVLVIGYYFADRPNAAEERKLTVKGGPLAAGVLTSTRIEIAAQFAVCLMLVIATAALFIVPSAGKPRPELAAAWIAGVGVAVGFYFKKTDTAADPTLAVYRAILALLITLAAIPIAGVRGFTDLPVQWISLVVIAIAFYFKET